MDRKLRLRAPNFTASDNMLLCDIVAKFNHVIENKKTDGANLHQKHAAWLEVAKIYNASTAGCTRTQESLQQTYKNLKKKAKKSASNAKMLIPVDKETLITNIEEHGTSSKGWEKVAENTGVSEEACQAMFAALAKEADTQNKILKKNVMGTGGGPPPNKANDPVLEKVKVLVGPVIDGMFTIYDGDSDIMSSQNKLPIEAEIVESAPMSNSQTCIDNDIKMRQDDYKTPDSKYYFTNDRANLKNKPHHLLTRKRKLELETPSKQTVSEKFKKLANEKMDLVVLQHELLRTQLEDEKEKLEHNRRLRVLEMEEIQKKYEHNEIMRNLELEQYNKK